jgi:hypothetical protein
VLRQVASAAWTGALVGMAGGTVAASAAGAPPTTGVGIGATVGALLVAALRLLLVGLARWRQANDERRTAFAAVAKLAGQLEAGAGEALGKLASTVEAQGAAIAAQGATLERLERQVAAQGTELGRVGRSLAVLLGHFAGKGAAAAFGEGPRVAGG